MRRPTSLLAAEALSIDAFTGRLTAFNILDAVYSASVPAQLARLSVAITYELTDEADAFFERVLLLSDKGKIVARSRCKVELDPKVPGRVPFYRRSLHALWSVRLPEFGEYSLVVEQSEDTDGPWEPMSSIRIGLVQGLLPGQPDLSAPAEASAEKRE